MILELFIFIIFPYVALATMIGGTIRRYFRDPYSFSSLSSQFLGSDKSLGLGSFMWHIGIIMILVGHFFAMLFTNTYKEIKESYLILTIILDIFRYTAAVAVVIGLLILIIRRIRNPRLRVVTSRLDWIVFALLEIQVITGLIMALTHLGDGFWFKESISPWIQGIFTFQPVIPENITPFQTFHVVSPFIIILLIPFTRLVHIFTFPIGYLWKANQLVVWSRKRPDMDN